MQTRAGAVRGLWRVGPGGEASAAFLGVPFAAPPTGDRRFAAPAPVEPWSGVRPAIRPGATPQRWQNPKPTLVPEPSVPGDETLNADVYTPVPDAGASLPVLVWIHGGGYVTGSHAGPWYDGAAFARDGVVTVTISYRLGFDGFGWIPGAPQNRGVLDWIAALEWVRDNIAAFGGDPARVTIAGQSAGAGAVLTLIALPAAQGLFRGAIALSPAIADVPAERARAISGRLAEILGVPNDRDGFARVDERGIERVQMTATRRSDAPAWRAPVRALRAALTDTTPYGPVVDGELIARPTLDALRAGEGAGVSLVIGATDAEFLMAAEEYRGVLRFVPASLILRLAGLSGSALRTYRRPTRGSRSRPVGPGAVAALGHYVSDLVFRRLVPAVAAARAAGPAPTWVYRFAWKSGSWGHALHCLDIPFFFDIIDAGGYSGERVRALTGAHPPRALADAVHGSAVSFVRTGDPGWPAWSTTPGTARVFDHGASAPDLDRDAYAEVTPLG